MNQLTFEQLDPIKIPLIQGFYKQHYPIAKAKKDEQIIVAKEGRHICAVVKFKNLTPYRLLTGMAVDDSRRRQGIGHQLLYYCEEYILDEQVYCFVRPHIKCFYQSHGFAPHPVEDLPGGIQTLYHRYTRQGKELLPMKYNPIGVSV